MFGCEKATGLHENTRGSYSESRLGANHVRTSLWRFNERKKYDRLFQLFPIEVKRLIVILVNVLFKVKGLDCAIFFVANLVLAFYLECNNEFSVIKYKDFLPKGLWNKPCSF